jgi:hypothetical protein
MSKSKNAGRIDKPKFGTWSSFVDGLVKSLRIKNCDKMRVLDKTRAVVEYVDEMRKTDPAAASIVASGMMDQTCRIATNAENSWDVWGKPYYKVWPGMADALSRCSMDLDSDLFHAPFETFLIRIPVDHRLAAMNRGAVLVAYVDVKWLIEEDEHIAESNPSEGLKALIDEQRNTVEGLKERLGFIPTHQMHLLYQTPLDYIEKSITTATFCVGEGDTMNDAVNRNFDPSYEHIHDIRMKKDNSDRMSDDDQREFVRIMVGVCMFATNSHEMVLPDVDMSGIERRFPKRRGADPVRQARIDKEIGKNRGWSVGREVILPRPRMVANESGDGGHSLSWSHIRSGHMRMQAHGKGRLKRKLKFIAPMHIRSDLPMHEGGKGYKVKP